MATMLRVLDIRLYMAGCRHSGPGPGYKLALASLFVLMELTQISYSEIHSEYKPDVVSGSEDYLLFTRDSYNTSIQENSIGKVFVVPTVKMGIVNDDPDLTIKYKILSGDKENFFKAESEHIGDFVFLNIRTRTSNVNVLNRERTERYSLVVEARFRGRNHRRLRGKPSCIVNVQVLDTNDLDPFFNPPTYSANVPEDTALHQSIVRVNAEDADSGVNGEVYYNILGETDQFSIHPVTGVISLTRHLLYAEKKSHRLTIQARDRGATYSQGPQRVDTASVTVNVVQVNQHDPQIQVQHLPEVIEQSHADIYAIIRIHDTDPGRHGQVANVEIIEGDPEAHFRVRPGSEPNEFNIEVLRLLDREISPNGYNLTLKATDKGLPPRSSYKEVHVRLGDMNDHPPVFNREEYQVRVPESALVNTPLTRLKVSDQDSGRNAEVILKIVAGNRDGQFRINPKTGILYVAKPLDHEYKTRYSLTVSALDQANIGMRKQSSARVKIYVEDVNDNDPVFAEAVKSIYFTENDSAGTRVSRLNAKDADAGENSHISYSIANLNADQLPFSIDHFTGIIKSKKLIDYESDKREYKLRVRASDWGTPYRRQSELKLTIKIKDINDNRPQFEREACVGKVSREMNVGEEIMTLSALDFDAGNMISYRVVSGNADACFGLDPMSGVLTAQCELARVPMKKRILNVTATDGQHFADVMPIEINLVETRGQRGISLNGQNSEFECRSTSVAKKLRNLMALSKKSNAPPLEDEFSASSSRYVANIHGPQFMRLPRSIRVKETVPTGTVVFKVLAKDRDLGFNGDVIYVISGGNPDGVFEVDMIKGDVKVASPLDREKMQDYMLNMTACDQGVPQKCTNIAAHIIVQDENDNPPVFMKSAFSFFFPENTRNGTPVVTLNATDKDSGANGQVTYILETQTEEFSLNSTSGLLVVSRELDRETREFYDLTIRAVDGNPEKPMSSFAMVQVRVLDVNDVAPIFTSREYFVKAREDLPVGTVLGMVDAADPDLYQGGQVTFSIDSGAEDKFYMDKKTGAVKIKSELDYETKQLYNLTVLAIDGGSPSLVSVASFVVEVLDVNENIHPPRFDSFFLEARVPENMPIGSHVTRVIAKDYDQDGSDDSRISYSIKGGDGLNSFSIDDSGNIKTLSILDRESKKSYWLTVYAQDHGAVPLFSKLEVFVEVLNVNDNVPLTLFPVYFPEIEENSKPSTHVVTLEAFDEDLDTNLKLVYSIISGDPQSLFSIDADTGVITTTSRKLDRETQPEHVLEVRVSDSGQPPLNSTTRVVVTVIDQNDNSPQFLEHYYKIKIPEMIVEENESLQRDQENTNGTKNDTETNWDQFFENSTWEVFDMNRMSGRPVFRVIASDKDTGLNSELSYSIKTGQAAGRFQIEPSTGTVRTTMSIKAGEKFELLVRCLDGGAPQLSDIARVSVEVMPLASQIENVTQNPPSVGPPQAVQVFESDPVGHLVALISATDKDGDRLFFDIVSGNEAFDFSISRDKGSVLVARQLDWERTSSYDLNISITDGISTSYTQITVTVIDVNERRPEFSAPEYQVNVNENLLLGSQIIQLKVTDTDEDQMVFYSFHAAQNPSSLNSFKINPTNGAISLKQKLDRERTSQHVITVAVKDHGTPSKKNFARLVINVEDHNDHAPEFLSQLIQTKLYETAEVGSSVVQALAIDTDKGENGRITYSILSGNIGNSFSIDPDLGILRVSRRLDMSVQPEYMLILKASDHGQIPSSSTVPVHILLTMADSAIPHFYQAHYATEVYENQPRGHFIIHVQARSQSSLFYEITGGNEEGMFQINPSTGIIMTKQYLDFETTRLFNLTVQVSNMVSAKATTTVDIHVLDVNDNAPRFESSFFEGNVSETAAIGSLILVNNSSPLVIKATDKDSGLNSLLLYEILEEQAKKFFTIDSSTGAIRTIMSLDFELQAVYEFNVRVSDMGKPRLSAETTAHVRINVQDQNDSPPIFQMKQYNAVLLLPTFANVQLVQVNATDPDVTIKSDLKYSITGGNDAGWFKIDRVTGMVLLVKPNQVGSRSHYILDLMVSDGKFTDKSKLNIIVKKSDNSGLAFSEPRYFTTVLENSTKSDVILVVNVLGSALNENLEFRLLNPTNLFSIGITSGALRTTGKVFDREEKEKYELIVEVRSQERVRQEPRIAHVIVDVTVLDLNDNPPMFVNKPYIAVVSKESNADSQVIKVLAMDRDKGANGAIYYQLVRGNGELFRVSRKSGQITLRQKLDSYRKEYTLTVAAYDGGTPPFSAEIPVHIKVVDKSVPMFTQQSYTANVAENIETFSPIISVDAESPTAGGKLIYTIESGNEEEQFSVDYNAGVVYVTQALDYERKQSHQLTLRATDSTAGGYSETILFIAVQDVNDCAPEFTQDSYTVSVSEALPFGSKILNVEARDQDTGINKEVEYNLRTDYGNASQLFNIDAMSGDIHLKRNLDAERQTFHHLTVIAMDKGPEPKSTETHVWVTVLDSNDNAPEFEEAEYVIHLSDQAHHGQFVGKVRAVDPDRNDHNKLTYSIIGGNEHQIFSINEANGIMSLVNLHKFDSSPTYNLNISVSDGVYSTSAKVTIRLMSANKHNPTFKKSMFEVRFPENSAEGTKVTEVLATDKDGDSIKYLIQSEELQQFFRIDQYTGEIWSEKVFDREETASYEIPITATDQGGRNGFTTVKITITDQNDNPPFFHLSEYKANIHTNLTIGSTVVKVLAEDKDVGKNALMTYSIYEKSESVGIVPQVFEINPNTGQIILKQSAAELENEVFQFFVRVEDNGRLSHHADIPVEIYIMSPLDQPPKFEERDSTYFIEEGSPVGQTITELSAVAGPDSQIRYTIASIQYTGEDALFQIDHTGRVIISNHLDREAQSTHKLTILAETDSSPTLNAYTELTIQVLDENDHAPEFQSNPYHVTVNEAVEAHTSILKVEALDKDFANNGEVRYSFTEDTKKLAHLFSIDPHHGWITTQGNLDFESEEYYILEVIATDNGQMKLSSTAVVKVRVIDYNDNPPVFSQRLYTAAVNEGALPGTIIFQLLTSDADYDARTEPEFFITNGDPLGQFQIKQNGEMYVARGLDRETKAQYRLEVTATDGVFVTKCRVTIEILDDNDSPPYCSKYVYRETISEGAAPGTVLATILVTDADEGPNAKQVFSLNGETSEHFSIDRDDGTLMTILPLDRETVDHHVILARVQDAGRPEWECVSRVELIVGDINDNKPQWIFENFTANMKEDIGVGTIVTKIHATDKDLGFNRRVSYSFLDSADGHFNVDERTGIVSLAKPLDRESEALYNLSIRAIDSGRPKLSSVSSLLVHILDVNDNPPQFASKYYFASISESVAVDTDVVRVLATSKDIGVNADITYSIIGGNEHRKFKMDSKTGLVSVAKELDHEHAKEYFLTIQARDGGIPPLSNHATVNITIMDANDNPPRFSHPSYSAVVNEASSVKSSVVTVTATDLDEGHNGKVTYQLVHGDRHQQFTIDSDTGLITVAQRLDREMISSYVLEVQAMDHGSPALSSSVLINVDIEDANDNAPVFPEGNYTVYVQEDKPYGHVLLRFSVTDSDDSPNGAPFTWDIRSGNEGGGFRVVQDGSLRTAKKFDHKLQNKYRLQIRVFDNGTPPLFSDSYVTVNIIEESQYPPVITPLDMEIFSYQDDFPGSIIGKIKASDQDPYDVLGYEIIPNFSSSQHIQQSPYLFEIDRRDGTIVALQGLDVGVYNLNVSVSDGKFTSFESARVTVTLVTDDVLDNAVIVRLADVSPEDFILSYRKAFIKIMKNLFNVRSQNVQILGAQLTYGNSRTARNAMEADTGKKNRKYSGRPNLDVLFAIRKSTAIYYSRREVRDSLEAKLSSVAAQLGLKIIEVQKDECTKDACSNGVCKDIVVMSDSQVIAVTTDIITLVSPQHHHDTFCQCKNGFAGDTCALILNECAKEPCHSSKVCVPDSSVLGYSCQCPSGFTGELCNVDISTCINTKCNIVNPMTFSGRSYAQYTLKSSVERHLSVSLGIKTRYEVSTIMFAHGLVDYSILEIISGKLQYRFNFGSGEGLVTLNDKLVNDGEWHDVRLERHGNRAEIAVDGKWRVNGAAPGLNDVLNLEQSDIYFGADVIEHQSSASGPEVSRGFVGCLDDIKVDHVPIPLHLDSDSTVAKLKSLANIEFKCGTLAEPGACGSHPCQHGGTCLENSSPTGYTCTCPTRFTGDNCDYDLDPCSTSPCLHGAKCVNLKNDFHCECPVKLSGKRCHYGKYCNPNPCQNKGICEEGLYGPICKCRGFTGEFCTIDINECLHQNPCHNGGTCINSPGGFHCICPSNSTGLYCSDLALVSLVPRKYALTLEEVVGIIASLFIIVIIVCLYVACRKFKVKRHRGNSQNLIQNDLDKEHIMMKQTRGGLQKLNNLDAVSSRDQDLPLLPQRPVSISPSMNETHFNYFDTVRSYGSAADELETLPRLNNDYIQNIQKPVATVAPSMMSDRHMNLKDNYFNSNPSSKCNAKSPTLESPRPGSAGSGCYRAARLRVNLPTEMSCTSDLSMEDDCQRYHWDCSDWANQSALPILSELAPGEIVDNNSWVSESNYGNLGNGHSTLPKPLAEPVDPTRDIETLAEGDNITLGPDPDTNSQTSECESQLGAVYPEDSPSHQTNKSIEELMMINDMNFMDEPESIDIPNMYDYRLHPNSYLPTYHLGISDNDDEGSPMLMSRGPIAHSSPDSQRYAAMGGLQPPVRIPQDPEAGPRKHVPMRGTMLSNNVSSDKLCQLEESDDDNCDTNSQIKKTPSPKVTRV